MLPLTHDAHQHNDNHKRIDTTIQVTPRINDKTLVANGLKQALLKKQLASECIKQAEKEIIFDKRYDSANNHYKQAYTLLHEALKIIRELPDNAQALTIIKTHRRELVCLLQQAANFLNESPNRFKANTISKKEIRDSIALIDTLGMSAENISSILCELCDWPNNNQERNHEKESTLLTHLLATFCKHQQFSRVIRLGHKAVQDRSIESIEKSAHLNQIRTQKTSDIGEMNNALTDLVANDKLDFLLVDFNTPNHQCIAKISLIKQRFGSELYQIDLFEEGKRAHRYVVPCHSKNGAYTGAMKMAILITSLHPFKNDIQDQLTELASEQTALSKESEQDYCKINATQNTYRLFDFLLKNTIKPTLTRSSKRFFMLGQDASEGQYFHNSFKQYLTEMLVLILELKSPKIADKVKNQRYQLSILRAFS